MISEFGEWLRTQTNRNGRPFQQETIWAYRDAALALSAWMTANGLESDFTGCDTTVLNRFFLWYHDSHSQGGTNTKQRNLRHLFAWLAREYDHPDPYTDALVRYSPAKTRPSTLAADFIKDLLAVTGDGHSRTFEDARDHAMIRVLTEGVRRAELVQVRLDDLPADLIARPYIRVVPLKGARAAEEGRIVPLSMATAKAINTYLRARRSHARSDSSAALWLGTRNRGLPTALRALLPGGTAGAGAEDAAVPDRGLARDVAADGRQQGDHPRRRADPAPDRCPFRAPALEKLARSSRHRVNGLCIV
jgi:site-specific recombinase XerD